MLGTVLMIIAFFLFQPPWDLETAKKFIIHYTYGCDYNMKVTRPEAAKDIQ